MRIRPTIPSTPRTNLICWITAVSLSTAGAIYSVLALSDSYWVTTLFGGVTVGLAAAVLLKGRYRSRLAASSASRWLLMCIALGIVLNAVSLTAFNIVDTSLEGFMSLIYLWLLVTLLGIWAAFTASVVITARAVARNQGDPQRQ